jgi:hypothetical protein
MHKQNQRNYASRRAKSKEIMHREGQNQRNYASRRAINKVLKVVHVHTYVLHGYASGRAKMNN